MIKHSVRRWGQKMNKRSTEYHAFLLRLWRGGKSNSWRATLQNPHTGERLIFPSLDMLLTFLEEETGESWVHVQEQGGDLRERSVNKSVNSDK